MIKIKNIVVAVIVIATFINIVGCEFVDDKYYGNIHTSCFNMVTIDYLTDHKVVVSHITPSNELISKIGVIDNDIIVWKPDASVNQWSSGAYYAPGVSRINNSHFIISYGNNTEFTTDFRIGEVVDDNIYYSSKIQINAGVNTNKHKIEMLTSTKFVIIYTESTEAYAQIGEITGSGISMGSKYLISEDISYVWSLEKLDDSHFLISFPDSSNSNYGTSKIGDVVGDTISFGSEYIFNSAMTPYLRTDFDDNNDKFIITYQDDGNSRYITSTIGNINGNNIIFGAEYDIPITPTFGLEVALFNSSHFIISYENTPNIDFVNGTIVGNNIYYNDPFHGPHLPVGNLYYQKIDMMSEYSFICLYGISGPPGNIGNGTFWDATPFYDPPTPHEENFNDLFEVDDTWSFISVIFGTYEDTCGKDLFWLIIILIPFIMTWIKQQSVIIPSILALICGSTLFVLLPFESVPAIKILLIVGISGIVYHILKAR